VFGSRNTGYAEGLLNTIERTLLGPLEHTTALRLIRRNLANYRFCGMRFRRGALAA
jgi:hypothetical protein